MPLHRSPKYKIYPLNRVQRKLRFIRAKNRVSSMGGLYDCHHILQEGLTVQWTSIVFMSERHKGRYYVASMSTLEHMQMAGDADEVFNSTYVPQTDRISLESMFRKIPRTTAKGRSLYVLRESETDAHERRELGLKREALALELNAVARTAAPTITVDTTCGEVAIGVLAVLDEVSLTPGVLGAFVQQFRLLGEPATHGLAWTGPSVEVTPLRLVRAMAAESLALDTRKKAMQIKKQSTVNHPPNASADRER